MKKIIYGFQIVGLVLGFCALAAPSKKLLIKTDLSRIEFLAVGQPSALRIQGKGPSPEGTLEVTEGAKKGQPSILKGALELDLSRLETGIALRDRHLKEKYLEVEKFKKARLVLAEVQVPSELISGNAEKTVTTPGELELHGVKKPVSVESTVKRQGNDFEIKSKFKVDLKDFGVTIPSFAGITVAKDVEVSAELKGAVP